MSNKLNLRIVRNRKINKSEIFKTNLFVARKKLCDHLLPNGESAFDFSYQDPGSGRNTLECKLCYLEYTRK